MAVIGSTDLGVGLLWLTVSHDPTVIATDAPKGSAIIDANGVWWRKLDDGETTNVELFSKGGNSYFPSGF